MQSQENFRYTKPFQNLGRESDLFHGGELDEQSRLYELCSRDPNFSVISSVLSLHFHSNIPLRNLRKPLSALEGGIPSTEEEWIDVFGFA